MAIKQDFPQKKKKQCIPQSVPHTKLSYAFRILDIELKSIGLLLLCFLVNCWSPSTLIIWM